MKKQAISFLLILLITFISGCINTNKLPTDLTSPPLKVGAMAGPHTEILYAVKEIAEKNGWTFEIVEFGEYDKPNSFLQSGKIDLNCFQNQFYLNRIIYERQYNFSPVAKSVLYPIGLYSTKHQSLQTLPVGSVIVLPDDPGNLGRSLALLAQQGLLTLKTPDMYQATLADIKENPLQLSFQLLDAAHTVEELATADLVTINANYAARHNLLPKKNALALENWDSPYTTLIVARSEDKDSVLIKQFVNTYRSPEVKAFIERRFEGVVLPAW